MAPIQGEQSRNSSPFPTFLLSSSTIINTLARPTLPAHVPGILIARRFPRIPRYPAPVKRPLKVYLPFKFLLIPQLQSARLSVPITPEIGGGGGKERREREGGRDNSSHGSPPWFMYSRAHPRVATCTRSRIQCQHTILRFFEESGRFDRWRKKWEDISLLER